MNFCRNVKYLSFNFQYTILDPRNNDEEYSLGEMSAGLAIGLFNPSNFTYPELEQRMGSIEM